MDGRWRVSGSLGASPGLGLPTVRVRTGESSCQQRRESGDVIAALAAYRKARAVELALAGHSYDEIAHELGLANRGTAWHMVQNALRERLFAAVDAYREAELTRLQRVEDALWPKAMAGNYRAGNAVLNVMDKRIRLLGLDQATRESNRCTCECPIHGSHGSWRPTRRARGHGREVRSAFRTRGRRGGTDGGMG